MRLAESFTLLSAVVVAGAGTAANLGGKVGESFVAIIRAASVTSGGTMKIEAYFPGLADWSSIDTQTITANGDYLVYWTGPILGLRANLSARTDGTYTVEAVVMF